MKLGFFSWLLVVALVGAACMPGEVTPAGPAPARGGATGSAGTPGSGGTPSPGTGGRGGASGGQGGGAAPPVADAAAADTTVTPDLGSGRDVPPAPSPDASVPVDAGELPPARGLAITLVEGAQGVFVPLYRMGAEVPAAQRRAELIEGRPLFVRAHVTPEAGFVARSLRGRLTVRRMGAPELTIEDEKMVSGPSRTAQLESSFNFFLPAEAITPTSAISITVHEASADAASPPPATPPRFPAEGSAALGVRGGKMELDLVLVRAVGVGGALMDTPERRQRVERYLYDVYPVQKLNVRWREPVTLGKRITYSEAFGVLQRLRMMDAAKPHEYYHLLVAVEDTTETLLGIASGAGAGPNDGARRIAMTFVRKRSIDSELDTISHELGHNHGRDHVAGCGAQGVDGQYPYPNTAVGVDGYSLSERAFKPAGMFKDLMGYCYPTWISDYTFGGFARRVRAVSAFASTSNTMSLTERSLQGFVQQGAAPVFGIVDGALVDPSLVPTTRRRARVFTREGARHDVAVAVARLGDERSQKNVYEIAAPLPASGDVTRIELTVDGRGYILDERDGSLP